jgi:hypothetical protein
VARIGEKLVFHDPCNTTVTAFDDHDVPLMEIAPAYLVRRYRFHTVSRHPISP